MAKRGGACHVATTRRRYKDQVYETHLLRRSYREGGSVKHETLANLSHLPPDAVEFLRGRLSGEVAPWAGSDEFEIGRTLPHGHVAAVLSSVRAIGLETVLGSRRSRQRDLVTALLVMRVLEPGSKLAVARTLREESATTSLFIELGFDRQEPTDREIYEVHDFLLKQQKRIENCLAERHLEDGCLVLYDVSSSYYTGTKCELAKLGYSRDGKKGFPQIVYGLLCNADGCPVAVEVFQGNTADPGTLSSQVDKLVKRFGLKHLVLVGDRGMLTKKRIDEDLRGIEGLDWVTALRADSIKKLARQGVVEMSLFDTQDLAEVRSPDYPEERLIVCRNPLLAEERARKREELIVATEKELEKIRIATARSRRPLRGQDNIGIRVGRVLNRFKVGKHFTYAIADEDFSYQRNEQKITEEATLDGLYVIRTSVPKETLDAEEVVGVYKGLSNVEQAFRSLKTIDLNIRPIRHRLENRVRAHVFLCMLAYYVTWHMRQTLAPMLFQDDDKDDARTLRESVVDPAIRSLGAKAKDRTKRTPDGFPVESFPDLLKHLATLAKNRIHMTGKTSGDFYKLTEQTPLQRRAFELLKTSP